MSTAGQFSSKNPTIKRILREASELANQPALDCHAAPLETDLFEWHFTLRGPPAPSPYEGGIYHGRIVLPAAYPLKPPSFRFLTPSGRFEANREICLSISGHHEETWQPAWGIRTALVAIRSFMDTDAKGQLGGMDASDDVRRRLAGQSPAFRCPTCSKSNEEIMKEHEEVVRSSGAEPPSQEEVPEQLRLAYREDLGQASAEKSTEAARSAADQPPPSTSVNAQGLAQPPEVALVQGLAPTPVAAPPPPIVLQQQIRARRRRVDDELPAWLNPAIYAVMAALVYVLWQKFL